MMGLSLNTPFQSHASHLLPAARHGPQSCFPADSPVTTEGPSTAFGSPTCLFLLPRAEIQQKGRAEGMNRLALAPSIR